MLHSSIARATAPLLLIVLLGGCQTQDEPAAPASVASRDTSSVAVEAPGFLYGRVTTHRGEAYEGRLRFGDGEEAFWDHAFNGVKDENPWAEHAPVEEMTEARPLIDLFGFEIPMGEREADLSRPFMARFGDLARIESRGDGVMEALDKGRDYDPVVRVTLKSGTAFDLDRNASSDFDDGVRVWHARRGVVDLGPRDIRLIEFLPTPPLRGVPDRLHGIVQTQQGTTFTGFLQWDREAAVASDRLVGTAEAGEVGLRFGTIQSIARLQEGGSLVALRDGREIALSGTRDVDEGNRGVYVEDPRYGRVLVSWEAFERVDFSPADSSGPGYEAFAPGQPLEGTVTTRDGRQLSGRLVFDLDESETTETLDAPADGVDVSIPLGQIAFVAIPTGTGRVRVVLRSGNELELEREGDLGESNAGVLAFAEGSERAEYVPWAEVARIDFDRMPTERRAGENVEPASR